MRGLRYPVRHIACMEYLSSGIDCTRKRAFIFISTYQCKPSGCGCGRPICNNHSLNSVNPSHSNANAQSRFQHPIPKQHFSRHSSPHPTSAYPPAPSTGGHAHRYPSPPTGSRSTHRRMSSQQDTSLAQHPQGEHPSWPYPCYAARRC